MSTDRWARLRQLFDAVCDLPDGERARRLAELCDDPATRVEVEALVAAQTADLHRASQPMGRMLDTLVETELQEGDQLGSWRLVERMGSGGMGAVFKAQRSDGQFDQRAAIKLLRGLPSEQGHHLLARERQILARLEHPGIARLIDGGETPGGLPYLVMEFIDGQRIDAYCREHHLGLRPRLVLLLHVAEALAYAHRRLILHCDLKPSNIMVRSGGQPVLLDFGVAHLLDQPGSAAGGALTPGYAAPEQLAGEATSVAVDVYGLGRLLTELVLDRRLVGSESVPPVHVARLAGVDLAWRAQLKGDIDLLVATATARDPADRYPTVEAFLADLRCYLDGLPLEVRGTAPLYRLGRLLRRRAPLAAALGLAAVVAMVAAWRVVDERNRALQAERHATAQARSAEDITGFLISLFESAHPGQHGGTEPSLRQLLDTGATRLLDAADLQAQPRAQLARTLAKVYGAIGLPDREADLLNLTLTLQDEALAGVEERLGTLGELITAESNRLRLDRAEAFLSRARQILDRFPDKPPLLRADLANSEGLLRLAQRRLGEAEMLFREALDLRRQHLGEDHLQVASVLHNLGLVALENNDPNRAAETFQRALDIKLGRIGERHPSYLLSLESLGRSRRDAGDVEAALRLLERAAELRLALHGENSLGTQRAFNELGAALHDAVRLEDAEHAYQRSLTIAATVAGEDSFEVAVVMNNLAFCLQDMGRMDEAEALYRRSLALRESLLGADDTRVLRLRSNLAWMLLLNGGGDEPAMLLEAALDSYRRHHPGLTSEHVNLELRLAYHALLHDQPEEARRHFEAAHRLESEWTRRNRDLAMLVEVRLALADDEHDALPLAERALQSRTGAVGATHPGRLPWLFVAVEAARRSADVDRAQVWLEEARLLVESTQAPHSPLRAQFAALLEDTNSAR